MRKDFKRTAIGLALLILVLGLAAVALAQVAPNFDLGWHLLSGGGGARSSPHHRIDDALGQWANGSSESVTYRIEPGFLYGVSTPGAPDLAISKRAPITVSMGACIALTIGGVCTDTGENLSRVHVQNLTDQNLWALVRRPSAFFCASIDFAHIA